MLYILALPFSIKAMQHACAFFLLTGPGMVGRPLPAYSTALARELFIHTWPYTKQKVSILVFNLNFMITVALILEMVLCFSASGLMWENNVLRISLLYACLAVAGIQFTSHMSRAKPTIFLQGVGEYFDTGWINAVARSEMNREHKLACPPSIALSDGGSLEIK